MNKKISFNFSVVLEILIWVFYVMLYKYSYLLEISNLPHIPNNDFPYPILCLFGICTTLFLIPYYRWAVPKLLGIKKFGWLFVLTIVYFIFLSPAFYMLLALLFEQLTIGTPVHRFFVMQYGHFFLDWNMITTDTIAFLCISFSRFSYQNEVLRHKIETDHLQLQLNMLKAQLQPHFLFNTLNSLYGMSLTGSKETPRFILLLSQMMQYILYDCNQENVSLSEEVDFLKGYFEIEQKKFPNASIIFKVPELLPDLKIPPLLFLPLVENSFKHGRHKLENDAGIYAELSFEKNKLQFHIENDLLPVYELRTNKPGGIGLVNIKKRLELYYPNQNKLSLQEIDQKYIAKLTIER